MDTLLLYPTNSLAIHPVNQKTYLNHLPHNKAIQYPPSHTAHSILSATHPLAHIQSHSLPVPSMPSNKSIKNSAHGNIQKYGSMPAIYRLCRSRCLIVNPKKSSLKFTGFPMKVVSPLQMSKHVQCLKNES